MSWMILQEKRRKPERTIEKQELNIFKSLLLLFTRGCREILKEADVLQGRQQRQDHKVSLGEPTFFQECDGYDKYGKVTPLGDIWQGEKGPNRAEKWPQRGEGAANGGVRIWTGG